MRIKPRRIATLTYLLVFAASVAAADTIRVFLPCDRSVKGWYNQTCENEEIEIPDGRPIYALLVSGFHQNRDLDMFHFYEFARCLQSQGAYVHYSWWNNLLAPYMEKPLHNVGSIPSIEGFPDHDIYPVWVYDPAHGLHPNKAIPAEDYQFQRDAKALLRAIRTNNPDAKIVLVGHSMGGDAIARLADDPEIADIVIDLVAPIDPVGNRTCVPNVPLNGQPMHWSNTTCGGHLHFTRWRATHEDYMDDPDHWWWFYPARRSFGPNVKYLYHRWQQEFMPPFDYSCPGSSWIWPCGNIYGDQPHELENFLFGVHANSVNDQGRISNDWDSGLDVPEYDLLGGGGAYDGHGEIVGFRGVVDKTLLQTLISIFGWLDLLNVESFPLALQAPPPWPSRSQELDPHDENDPKRLLRVGYMKRWEKHPNYLYQAGFEPWNPGLCMVSRDLCNILDGLTEVPLADAGADQTVPVDDDCMGQVSLDGTGSTDPGGAGLTYLWSWNDGANEITGPNPTLGLPPGDHEITLVVNNGQVDSDPDTVLISVVDTLAPTIESVTAVPATLWPPNHSMIPVQLDVVAYDICDPAPGIVLVSVTSNEPDDAPGGGDGHTADDIQDAAIGTEDYAILLRAERQGGGGGRVYSVTYSATDASGNGTHSSTSVTVAHDGAPPRPRRPGRE